MKILQKTEYFIFESPAWKLITVMFTIMIFKTGIWYIPNLEASRLIAQNPFANPFTDPDQHYLFWSWFGPFVAWSIGAVNKWDFFLFHLLFSMAFSWLFVKVVFSQFSDKIARTSLILFCILPVSATAYFWVSLDSITLFILFFSMAYPKYSWVTFIAGVFLGMQHFEQGFFASAGLLFATLLTQKPHVKYPLKFCYSLFLGVIIGKLILIGIFNYYTIDVNSGRWYWLIEHIHRVVMQFFFHFHHIIWSVLGLGWLVVFKYLDYGKEIKPFFLTLAGLMLLLLMCEDQTRVLAIVTFPLIAVYWLLNEDFLKYITKTEVAIIFLIWIITPWSWVWFGAPRWSVFPYNLAYIFHNLFGWFDVPQQVEGWPFF